MHFCLNQEKCKVDMGQGEVTGQAPQSHLSMTLGSCDISALENFLPKHIIYLIYIHIYIYISPPPLHTAVNWLPILLGSRSLMCWTLLQRHPSIIRGNERMEQEGYSTQRKERELNSRNSWAPLKTNRQIQCVCLQKLKATKKLRFPSSPPKQGGKRSSLSDLFTTKQRNWALFLLVPCLPPESLRSPCVSKMQEHSWSSQTQLYLIPAFEMS